MRTPDPSNVQGCSKCLRDLEGWPSQTTWKSAALDKCPSPGFVGGHDGDVDVDIGVVNGDDEALNRRRRRFLFCEGRRKWSSYWAKDWHWQGIANKEEERIQCMPHHFFWTRTILFLREIYLHLFLSHISRALLSRFCFQCGVLLFSPSRLNTIQWIGLEC